MRLLRPQGGAELLESRQRVTQCLSRRRALPRTALDRAEREQRSCVLERHWHQLVCGQRLLERSERDVDLAACRGEKPAAAAGRGERRRAVQGTPVFLEPAEKHCGILHSSEREQRLDLIGHEADCSRLAYPSR